MPSDDDRWLSTPSPPPKGFPRACFICIMAIPDQETFDRHMEDHRNMPLLNCNICNRGFLNEKLLSLHHQVIHPNLCDICNIELETTRKQIDHILEFHPDVVEHIPFDDWHAGNLKSIWPIFALFYCLFNLLATLTKFDSFPRFIYPLMTLSQG